MQATYGIDLGEAVFGVRRLSMRRLWVLVKGLPPRSALARSMYPEETAWGLPEHLLGTIAEILANVYRPKGEPPIHIRPRPKHQGTPLSALLTMPGLKVVVDKPAEEGV